MLKFAVVPDCTVVVEIEKDEFAAATVPAVTCKEPVKPAIGDPSERTRRVCADPATKPVYSIRC